MAPRRLSKNSTEVVGPPSSRSAVAKPKMAFNNPKLRQSAPPELSQYFLELLRNHDEESISAHILAAVESESVPPTVVGVWLSVARTSESLLAALTQDFSVTVRRVAIKRIFRLLRRRRWRKTWEGLGGTPSLLVLLKRFSVFDVKLCLARFVNFADTPDRVEKQSLVEEVLRGLLPLLYPDAPFKTADERPLANYYKLLVPGCSSKFVDEILRDNESPLRPHWKSGAKTKTKLLREHYDILREQSVERIFVPADSLTTSTAINDINYLMPLLQEYPPLPSPQLGVSESMAFSLLVLRRAASQPDVKVNLSVITALTEPLLFRVRKKKVDSAMKREILDLSIEYLLSRPEMAHRLKLNQNNRFLNEYVKLWASLSTDQNEIESRLISLFKMMPSETLDVGSFDSVLRWVGKPLRYRFLKLLFLHLGDKGMDIDDITSLSRLAIKAWPCALFTNIDRDNATALLTRLRNSSPYDNFLTEQSGTILSRYAAQGIVRANSSILLNVLEKGEPSVLGRATAAVDEMKKKAVKSREQNDRALNISAALFFAISSATIELYKETLVWARRFVHDPLTVKTIFSSAVANTKEGIRLLSGIPDEIEGLKPPEIAHKIQFGNETIFEAFETACSAVKEPSFHHADWAALLGLFGAVLRRRLSMSKRVQKILGISDNKFYDLIFRGALELGLRIERIGLQPGYELLQLRNPSGLLSLGTLQGLESVPALRFIDSLAEARDSLWKEFRTTIHPAVTALPPPLPRGLPIQCLTNGFNFSLMTVGSKLPFIFARAEGILFTKPDEALVAIPEYEDTRSAIGGFVDDFAVALRIYVCQDKSVAKRQSHAMRVWDHCMDKLSARMSRDEAHRTWKKCFELSLHVFEVIDINPRVSMEYPMFPFGAEVGEYTEWNPAETYNPPSAVKSRVLQPLTYLDCTVAQIRGSAQTDLNGEFVETHLHTEGFQPRNWHLWDLKRMSRKQLRIPALREGLIVSALLFLENRIPGHKSVFLRPFPSATDVRYPDVWLDLSFTEAKGIRPTTEALAFGVLDSFCDKVPPTLLYRLAEASLAAVFQPSLEESHAKITQLEGLAYGFLSLLAKSDRPSLAIELVLKTVIERPDSSSWHRKLLSRRFLRSLSQDQAKDLIQSFADVIKQKSKDALKDAEETVKVPSGGHKTGTKPYIKITTVKYLAQLLEDANFIPENFAIDILGSLFKTSTHIDIRTAIVQSLMQMLSKCTLDSSDSLGDRILKVLELAIPISGSLDERRQLSQEDWEEVENTGKLPDIYEEGTTAIDRCVPPIIGAIYNPLICNSVGVRWLSKVFEQILIPILETSISENTRWLKIFTAKHDLNLHSLHLPLLPVKMKILKDLLQYDSCYLPGPTMDLYLNFVLTNMSPPREVAELNNKLLDPTFRDLPEVKHWLSLYGHGPKIFSYDGFHLINVLRKKWVYPEESITPQQLQNHLFEQAKVLILTNNTTEFNTFITLFQPWGHPSQYITSTNWLLNARQPLEHIISLIHTLRTPEWQRNHHRQPEILPQTLRYRLWLAPYPTTESTEAEIAAFATAFRGFVKEICHPKKLYHEELPEVIAALKRVLPVFRAQIACLLGALRDDMSQIDLVCVELARTLFETADVPKSQSMVEESKIVVQSWRDSADEDIRKKGMELSKKNGMGKLQDISGGFGFLVDSM